MLILINLLSLCFSLLIGLDRLFSQQLWMLVVVQQHHPDRLFPQVLRMLVVMQRLGKLVMVQEVGKLFTNANGRKGLLVPSLRKVWPVKMGRQRKQLAFGRAHGPGRQTLAFMVRSGSSVCLRRVREMWDARRGGDNKHTKSQSFLYSTSDFPCCSSLHVPVTRLLTKTAWVIMKLWFLRSFLLLTTKMDGTMEIWNNIKLVVEI